MKQSRYEKMVVNQLRDQGYYVVKSAGSFGLWDLVAWLKGSLRWIQVKRNQGPRSAEREALIKSPHLYCPKCGYQISSKEIWLYKYYQKPEVEILP